MPRSWIILTGEYPPMPGGVSDYTRNFAGELARRGETVHVVSPARTGQIESQGVTLHELPDHFGPRSLLRLPRLVRSIPRPRQILVQYVPHAFGFKAMNTPLCAWLSSLRSERLAVMFHEVVFPMRPQDPFRHQLLGRVTRWNAAMLLRTASPVFVSTLSWTPLLRDISRLRSEPVWLPIPSNMPLNVDPITVASQRKQRLLGRARLLGSFGTFGSHIAGLLSEALARILASDMDTAAILIGRGAARFSRELIEREPSLESRLTIADGVPAQEASELLSACDLLVQPYPDGITSRRTSAMAGLALGVATVTNRGALCEPFWDEQDAVALADSPEAIVDHALRLLADNSSRMAIAQRGRQTYERWFSLQHVVGIMQQACARPERRSCPRREESQ